MNLVVFPSWYPSANYPISGNFVEEQIKALCVEGKPVWVREVTRQQALLQHVNTYNSATIRQDFINRFSSKAVLPQLYTLHQEIIAHYTSTT